MGFWNAFPYTNFHDLNIDWILDMLKTLESRVNVSPPFGDSFMQYYQTFQTMIDSPLISGNVAVTSGYREQGDGGGAVYFIWRAPMFDDVRTTEINETLYVNLISPPNVINLGMDASGNLACDNFLKDILLITKQPYFPPGVYRFAQPITSVFTPANNGGVIFKFDKDGFILDEVPDFDGLTLDGDGTVLSVTMPWTPGTRETKTLCNCEFRGTVHLSGTRELNISECRFYTPPNIDALQLNDQINTVVTGCTFASQIDTEPGDCAIRLTVDEHQNEGVIISDSVLINYKTGISFEADSLACVVSGCIIDQMRINGVKALNPYNLNIDTCYIQTRSDELPACDISTNKDSFGLNVDGCDFAGGNYGLSITGTGGAYFSRAKLYGNTFDAPSLGEIRLHRCGQTAVRDTIFDVGIYDNDSSNNYYTGNTFPADRSKIHITTPDNIYRDNFNFILENSGGAILNASETVVEHGLLKTPETVVLSPVNGEVNLWVTDLNENSFTVHTSGHPVQIGWIAKIKNI